MNQSIIFTLIRNSLASWLISIEFVAPLIIGIVAKNNRKQCPRLSRRIWLPVISLITAGLVKQLYMQFILPLAMVTGNIIIDDYGYIIYIILYSALLLFGYCTLLWMVFDHRRISVVDDRRYPFGDR